MCAKKKNGKKNGNSTDLICLSPEQYPALADDAAETILANMGEEEITPADLSRIRVPSGDVQQWTVLGSDGQKRQEPHVEGVILHHQLRRGYWLNPIPSGEFPDCMSNDWKTGKGDPGGDCETCPHNEWGSAIKADGSAGRGKVCRQMKLLFMLRHGEVLPDVVVVSPASLKAVKHYQLKLGARLCDVVTRLELVPATSRDNTDYSQIRPLMVGKLDAQTVTRVRSCVETLQQVFEASTVTREDANGNG